MTQTTLTGIEAIGAMFEAARVSSRPAFLPYFPIGYPDYGTSLDIVEMLSEAGADGFEIGMPFSDPLADGPTIQAATQVALDNGITVRRCLDAVRELRGRDLRQPMLLMGYLNPILAYGIEPFVGDAKSSGADGLIIPDLPPEEAADALNACRRAGLALVFFLAPTSDERRIRLVAEHAHGFIYVVSLTGVTGARSELPADLRAFISRVRQHTYHPLVLGFGISQPEHARALTGLVDGYIVGSALVKAAAEGVEAVRALAASLRGASG